jgi:hypothetical protein
MIKRIYAEAPQRVEVKLLYVQGGWFQYYLILVIVLKPIWIFSVSAVSGSAGWFNIRNIPRFRSEGSKKSGRVESSCAYLKIVGLLNYASIVCPVFIKGEYQFLKVHALLLSRIMASTLISSVF